VKSVWERCVRWSHRGRLGEECMGVLRKMVPSGRLGEECMGALCKMVPSGRLGEECMGALCTVFATSYASIIISK